MRVRAARLEDAAVLAAIYRPYVEESAASFEDVAPDGVAVAARMATTPRLPWLVAEDDAGRVVGYAYATGHRARAAYRWSADCSIYLLPESRRRGIGRLLYSALLTLLRDLGYRRAYAGIALPNPASVALHETMGFTLLGVYQHVGYKFGRWHDVAWWQLSLAPSDTVQDPPDEPRAWSAVL